MTQFLPPNLLALFAPRDPIKYLPPTEKLPFEKKTHGYTGVSQYLDLFEVRPSPVSPGDELNINAVVIIFFWVQDPKDTPAPVRIESREERLERKKREKAEQAAYKLEQGIALCEF
jgi:U1 small nuclear ribonucleoprotein